MHYKTSVSVTPPVITNLDEPTPVDVLAELEAIIAELKEQQRQREAEKEAPPEE